MYLIFSCHQHEILRRSSHFRILREKTSGDELDGGKWLEKRWCYGDCAEEEGQEIMKAVQSVSDDEWDGDKWSNLE